MDEDSQRTGLDFEFDISVEWAPAYELVIAYTSFAGRRRPLHADIELGMPSVRRVRSRLPADFGTRVRQLDELVGARAGKSKYEDLFWQLVNVCPADKRDTPSFLDWFGRLSAGDAYEALVQRLPASSPGLPRDFR